MFKNWVDVCGGKMTLKEVVTEVDFHMRHRAPTRIIVDIKLQKDGYHTKLWMSEADFSMWHGVKKVKKGG